MLRAVVDHYEKRIAVLEAEIATLKKSPRNSSLPPSAEDPHAKPVLRKKRRGRPGGRPGHAKLARPLIPSDQSVTVVTVRPQSCRRCGERLAASDPAPWHRVWDVPEIKPLVTQYQRHRLTCFGCGVSTCGELPAGVPHGQAGPKLIALVAMLMGCFKQSKRRVALFVEQLLNQLCSAGWVVKLQNQATGALRPVYDELTAMLPAEAVLGIDESPCCFPRHSGVFCASSRQFRRNETPESNALAIGIALRVVVIMIEA